MKLPLFRMILMFCLTGVSLAGCTAAATLAPPDPWELPNGIRVVLVPIPESEHVSVFTYLPMGLAWDPAGKTQWSHLVEHVVLRGTHTGGLQEVNAETLPDHMRLDYYGTVDTWRDGLSFHAAWLSGGEVNQDTFAREVRAALSECDVTARNQATHKFAMAAWAQACRHGRDHAAVKGDLEAATLGAIQQYRADHLAVLNKAVVCIVGGVTPEEARTATADLLGGVTSNAVPAPAAATVTGKRSITWDLPTRHLVLTWQVPPPSDKEYAALYAAAAHLQMQMFQDEALKKSFGLVFAGADLAAPEGSYFYVNGVLQPGASFEDAAAALEEELRELRETGASAVPMTGNQLSYQLTQVPDPSVVRQQAPRDMTDAMIEGNLGLQWGMREFQFGPYRGALARNLSALTGDDVRAALGRHLTPERRLLVTIEPE